MYDSKYEHGLSWLDNHEKEPCSTKILLALYGAIYDENADPTIVGHLMTAYEAQLEHDYDDLPEPRCLAGNEAWKYMRDTVWFPEFKRHLVRHGFNPNQYPSDDTEVFHWPESLPSRPIRVRILKSIGLRMAAADAWLAKCLRDAAEQEAKREPASP
jgi:hypothetical protein